jgi:pimeloyl-ACP methyl ester carboxylesterase
VSIGGGRSLFVHCVGSGSPAVVLAAGLKSGTSSWREVQPQLGRITRTCSYDRAGDGNSVAPPGSVSSGRTELADLAALLDRARIAPPWVLVGHSYGGLLARLLLSRPPRGDGGAKIAPSRRPQRTFVKRRRPRSKSGAVEEAGRRKA